MSLKPSISEILECLGFRDYGSSKPKAQAVYHYEPLFNLYKREIPSLFGCLLRDEGIFLDRADSDLFEVELEGLLQEFGPLIWPGPGQGPRDHLLTPQTDSGYTSDLVYPRDNAKLKQLLRSWILRKTARPDTNVNALIEKRPVPKKRKETIAATKTESSPRTQKQLARKSPRKDVMQHDQQVLSTDEGSDMFSSFLEDSALGCKMDNATSGLNIALRLHRRSQPEEVEFNGPCCSYGTMFLNDDTKSIAECFNKVEEHAHLEVTYIEFHPPEDMTLEGRIRINKGSEEADKTWKRVVTILQGARKFPAEPSYRTVETEIGVK